MDYLLIGIVLFVLFFSLRTNYKISNFEEMLKRMNHQNKVEEKNNVSKIIAKIDSLEKRTVVLQKLQHDYQESNDLTSTKNLTVLRKELSSIKNDIDLIKTIYLKTSPNNGEQEVKTTKEISETAELFETEPHLKKISPPENKTNEDFHVKVKEKLENMNGDEIWILRQLLSQEPLMWQNVVEMHDDISMPQFQIPKLSRKFIIDGLPVVMIKNAGDKMRVKWGDGLTEDKIGIIKNEIRGDW